MSTNNSDARSLAYPPDHLDIIKGLNEISEKAVALVETGELSKLNLAIDMTLRAIDHARSVKLYPTTMVVNLVNMLSKRYHHTHSRSDVELGLSRGNTALRLMDRDDPTRLNLYANLGMLHHMRYDYQEDPDDLDRSIEYTITAIRMSQEDSVQHDLQFNLSMSLYSRSKKSQDIADLDRSIQAIEAALRLCPTGNPTHASRMYTMSGIFLAKIERTKDLETINRSISFVEEVLRITNQNDHARPRMLMDLGIFYETSFENTRNIGDLEKAIKLSEEANELARDGHEECATIQNQLAKWLFRRYEATESEANLKRAIAIATEASVLAANDPRILNNLANFLARRFHLKSGIDDLNSSIIFLERARENSQLDDPVYAQVLHSLAIALVSRFEFLGDIEDLELGIVNNKKALERIPKDHPDRFRAMINQAVYIELRFKHLDPKGRSSSTEDLDEAMRLTGRVLQEAPLDHPDRASWLEIHGNMLGSHFETDGDAKALDKAILFTSEALAIMSQKDHTQPSTLSHYGEWLGHRFELTGDIHDLNKAIEVTDRAVKATLTNDRRKALWQSNLGRWLEKRFERVGALMDLNNAIKITEIAVDSTPRRDVERPARGNCLSYYYARRYERGNCIDDLNKSIDILRDAIDETPPHHTRRPLWMINLASRLAERGITGMGGNRKDDLDDAVRYLDENLRILPANAHQDRAIPWTSLGSALRHRFVHFGQNSKSTNDIDRSIQALTEAMGDMHAEHRSRAATFLNLGVSHLCRFRLTENSSPTDLDEALSSFMECFHSPNSPLSLRIEGASRAASILDSQSRSQKAAEILKDAIDLFPALSPRSLSRSDQQHALGVIAGIAPMATAMALKSGHGYYAALMLLERGRGIIASLLMEMRMDMSKLDSEAASKFLKAREELETLQMALNITSADLDDETSNSRYVSKSLSLHKAEDQLLGIIKEIQVDPKTDDFLQPPSEDELMKALDGDTIVVVNATTYRCDAFVINKQQGVSLVELTRLKLEDVSTRVERLRSSRPHIDPTMLEWLWDNITSPILEKLGFNHRSPLEGLPRIFWILTGPLSRLPIHAAGRHTKGSTQTVMDTAMSSYSSSLRSFVYGRKAKPSVMVIPQEGSAKKALLVGMSKTPSGSGLPDLPFAAKEVDCLENMCPLLNLQPVRLPNQTREAVLAELGAPVFHFAGHGQLDPVDPSQSGLCLEDGLLTVADIQAHKLGEQVPFLGYLSACLTGANDVDRLVDEGIHLISACQLAGFHHVIGALWQVYDDSCVEVAELVYRSIAEGGMTDRSVCAALHRAIVNLRDVWVTETSAVAPDRAGLSTAENVETAYNTAGENNIDEDENKDRDGRLLLGRASVASFVKADWVPYVHYGP